MRHMEEDLQQNCVTWFRLQYPEEFKLLHHSPNGGRRTAREGGRFKAMGTKAGFPDLALLIPRGGCHGLFVELKTDKGTQTASQKEWEALLESQGYEYRVCRSFGEFSKTVTDYLQRD